MTRFVVLMLIIGAAASCQSIIGLGDEPSIAPGCGLPRSPGPVCGACLDSKCCNQALACAADPECKATVENCVRQCFKLECFLGCIEKAGKPLTEYFNCATTCAGDCDPQEACKTLADCCPGVDASLQKGCADNARSENQELCQSSVDQLMCAAGGAPAE